MKDKYPYSLFDASLALAFITAILYSFGYVYFESYYAYFNVPFSIVEPEKTKIIMYGIFQPMKLVIPTIIYYLSQILIHTAPVAIKQDSIFKNIREKIDKIPTSAHQLIITICIFVLYANFFMSSNELGKKNAEKNYKNGSSAVEVLFKDKTIKQYGFLSATGSKYVFFELEDPQKPPTTKIVENDNIVSLTFIGDVAEARKNNLTK